MNLNILLVDDSDVIRTMIERTIRLADVPVASVHHASNGRQALDVLDREWIDLVLADLNMPIMDGAEMLRRIRDHESFKDVPVIIVSTEGATQRIDDLSACGVAAWVRKPFTPEEIRDVIDSVTRSWQPLTGVESVLDEVVGTVLEAFAYVFPEVAEGTVELAPGTDLLRADIGFQGAVSGTLSVVAPFSVCTVMAANAMGLDADDAAAAAHAPDTLAEIANITAGHLCTRLEQHAATRLMPPVVTRTDASQAAPALCAARTYLIDDEPVGVYVALRPAGGGA